MKILYANQVFLDYRVPFYKELVRLLDNDFYVMYSPNRYHLLKRDDLAERIKQELGVNAITFKHDYLFDTATMSFNRVEGEYGQKIPFMYGFLRAIRKVKPDVLITEAFFQWTPWGILYSMLFRIPLYIGYERTCHTERNTGKLKTWHRKISDKFIKGYLVNGIETEKYLMSIGIKQEKIHRIGISADSGGLTSAIKNMTEAERSVFRKKYMGEDYGLLFLFSGQIVKRKGVNFLLKAWKKHVINHPNDKLVLIGYGDMYDVLKLEYDDEKSIYMEGKVNYGNVYKYYAIADVFVLPTIEDNWSLVIPEAMACGLPVATSIYNGCHPELVKKGVNGITFDTFKEESIVEALDYFHHQDLKRMGQKSVEIERIYNTEHCAYRVYETIIVGNH